jgi:hypothetical protein
MGMLTQLRRNNQDSYLSGGTSSFPITGFPKSAYRGNNRMSGGGQQSQPSSLSGLGTSANYDPKHVLITVGVLIIGGYFFWHLDNK